MHLGQDIAGFLIAGIRRVTAGAWVGDTGKNIMNATNMSGVIGADFVISGGYMAGFDHYAQDTAEIESELVRKGIALGIDWSDKAAVRALAHEALNHLAEDVSMASNAPVDYQMMAKVDLFGLAGLMLKTMTKSATQGIESHGGPAWKAFAQALWEENELRSPS